MEKGTILFIISLIIAVALLFIFVDFEKPKDEWIVNETNNYYQLEEKTFCYFTKGLSRIKLYINNTMFDVNASTLCSSDYQRAHDPSYFQSYSSIEEFVNRNSEIKTSSGFVYSLELEDSLLLTNPIIVITNESSKRKGVWGVKKP